jgi:hypothetical protein
MVKILVTLSYESSDVASLYNKIIATISNDLHTKIYEAMIT